MNPTLEERLARYGDQLDAAARARLHTSSPATATGGAHRGPGRRVLVAALGVAVALAIAVGIAIANRGGGTEHVAPASITTSATATTPPTHTVPTTEARSTSTTTTPPPTAPPSAGTRSVVYNPFVGSTIDPRLHVTAQLSGTCLRTRAGTRDSYRCFAASGGAIYDPCFAGPSGTAQPLVCPKDPLAPDVVELRATSVTDNPPTSTSRPWAIQLANGQLCEFVPAAWGGLGPYSCPTTTTQTGAAPVADCHEPRPSRAPRWIAACQQQETDSSPFGGQFVDTLWY